MEDRELMLVRWLSCFISVKHTIKFPVRFGGSFLLQEGSSSDLELPFYQFSLSLVVLAFCCFKFLLQSGSSKKNCARTRRQGWLCHLSKG